MQDTLSQLANDIVKHDPKLFGTLTEIVYGQSNEYKLERILDWGNQWGTSARKQKTGKRPPEHS